MYLIILGLAKFIISISLSTIIVPATIRNSLDALLKKKWLWPVSAIRIIFGIVFLMAADQCSMPTFITVMGVVLIIAGISVPIMGRKRIESLAQWWMNQKDWVIRIWGFIAMLFGIAVALAGMPV